MEVSPEWTSGTKERPARPQHNAHLLFREERSMKTISEQMELARKAQAAINDYTQEQVDEMCLSVGWEVYEDENIAKLARMAVARTPLFSTTSFPVTMSCATQAKGIGSWLKSMES